MKSELRKPSASLQSLDWINFCMADVQMAAAAFVTVYLSAMRHWSPAQVGIVVAAQNIATMIGQPAAGALIDRSERKQRLVAAAAAVVALGCIVVLIARTTAEEAATQILIGLASAIFPPAIAALSLGLVGHEHLASRVARNEAFNHAALVERAIDRCRLRVHAITGDHDCATGSLDLFQRYLSPLLHQSFSKAHCHFALLNSVAIWEPPQFGLGANQLAWLEEDLATAADDGLRSVLFMHGYPSEHGSDAVALRDLIRRRSALMVDMGHTHYNELANDGHTIYATTRSTGQIEEGPVGFSIVTLDHSVVSWKFKPIAEWPLVMITSPSDNRLIVDPASPQQVVRGLIAVRARAWGDDITSVTLRVDSGQAQKMLPSGDALWSAEWNSARSSDRLHSLVVQARDRSGRFAKDEILVLLNQAGDYRPALHEVDNALGAWPEKHILGTQLGPNRNGRKWPSTREARTLACIKGLR